MGKAAGSYKKSISRLAESPIEVVSVVGDKRRSFMWIRDVGDVGPKNYSNSFVEQLNKERDHFQSKVTV